MGLIKGFKPGFCDGSPGLRDQIQIKMNVMKAGQPEKKQFTTHKKVSQVGFGEILAGVAAALGIQRIFIQGILGPFNADFSLGGEKGPISGISGGHDTIEHVYAASNIV